MGNRLTKSLFGIAILTGLLSGCRFFDEHLHYLGDGQLEYYQEVATEVAYPDVRQASPEEVLTTSRPRTLFDRRKDEIWNLTLVEALHTALSNNAILRSDGDFRSAGNSLLRGNQAVNSVYDPAIQETGFLFGGRGVESALAAFDTQFNTSMIWGRNEVIPNNLFFGGGRTPGQTLVRETGDFNAELQKQFGFGGQLTLGNTWNYEWNNTGSQLFPSAFSGNVQAEYRHPLWQGAGTEFTQIAGPITQQFSGITGVNQGVVISRINNDITIAEFEAEVRNLLRDVENLYWQLYLNYRLYDTAVAARNSAKRTWQEAKAKLEIGGVENFKPADEAQARDRYFETQSQVDAALADIYRTEVRLRRLIGLPVNDGRIIRPADEPTTAKFIPDWDVSLAEALVERVELRKQKWSIKSLELQLRAAKSLTNPRLDFVSGYQVNALGDQLFGQSDDDEKGTPQGLNSAFENLTQGDQTGWQLGFEMTMPLGFRQAHAQVRNIELRLAKARELLATQELEISHELATAVQDLASAYTTAKDDYNRLQAARRREDLFEAELEAGTVTADEVLRAQASVAEAESSYYTSLTEYNQAIIDFYFRKGTLLEHNNVRLAEDQWTPEAYKDAFRRAWARSHAISNPHLETEPQAFALPGFSGDVPFSSSDSSREASSSGKKEAGPDQLPPAPAETEAEDSAEASQTPPPAPSAN